ncbi:MAG: type II 3-dehydroquinate dehydratase [Pseudomonadota bacterium]|nr:type II 3-dehydroquinate dehydratase [Pseudomonadota bacterium]QKK05515.1 MAG: type II 3-dehydroquinate dehydratase [Pseudomonadota bacterium]
MQKICVINGPNLNMLGKREPDIYGHETLADIEALCQNEGESLGLSVSFFQSNGEGEIVTKIQNLLEGGCDALIINAAAYTHTSVAIADALAMLTVPVIEVHLSNIHKRESFRHHSYISSLAAGVICGFGSNSYVLALHAAKNLLEQRA